MQKSLFCRDINTNNVAKVIEMWTQNFVFSTSSLCKLLTLMTRMTQFNDRHLNNFWTRSRTSSFLICSHFSHHKLTSRLHCRHGDALSFPINNYLSDSLYHWIMKSFSNEFHTFMNNKNIMKYLQIPPRYVRD